MDKIIAVGVVIILLVIGRLRVVQNIKHIITKITFSDEFAENVSKFVNNQGKDYKVYSWLLQKSEALQMNMGRHGIIDKFYIPFSQLEISNFEVILNALPAIHEEFGWETVNPQVVRKYYNVLMESILRYRGKLLNDVESYQKSLRNPLEWLREGASWVVLLPFSILNWFHLLSDIKLVKISANPFTSFVSSIGAVIATLGSLVTIVIGWDAFVKILQDLFS